MNDDVNPSIVEYFGGDSNGHQCGYCKTPNGSKSHGKFRTGKILAYYSILNPVIVFLLSVGMWAHSLDVQDYENLIDRGWRRSGNNHVIMLHFFQNCQLYSTTGHYCYKPMMKETCCPLYTIRCDATNFQLNHSHKKVLKKVQKFLIQGGKMNKNPGMPESSSSALQSDDLAPPREEMPPQGSQNRKVNKSEVRVERKEGDESSWKVPRQKKAKIIRLERKMQKTGSVEPSNKAQTPSKSLEEFLAEDKPNTAEPAHRLEIKLVNTSSPEFKDTLAESAALYAKYQMSVHKDTENECTVEQFKRFLVKSPLQVHSATFYFVVYILLGYLNFVFRRRNPMEDCPQAMEAFIRLLPFI